MQRCHRRAPSAGRLVRHTVRTSRAPLPSLAPPPRLLAAVALTLLVAHPGAAHADVAGFAIGGVPEDANSYVYSTKDLAVDLASPLAAYKVASLAFNQEVPKWLDVIIYGAVAAALLVVLTDNTALDGVLK